MSDVETTSGTYVQVPESEVPEDAIFTTPRRHQGQAVEVSYSTGLASGNHEADEGDPFRRTVDRSSGTTTYHWLAR